MQEKTPFPTERLFSDAEYSRRLKKTREQMERQGLGVLLLFDPSNICYLSGHHSVNLWDYQCMVVPADAEPFLIIWNFESGRFRASAWLRDAVTYRTEEDPIPFTARVLRERGLLRFPVGIESGTRYLPVRAYERLRASLNGATLLGGSGVVGSVRVVKSSEEIAVLRKAAAITSQAMKAALAKVGEGALDRNIAAEAAFTLYGCGSEFVCIEPIVAVGYRAGLAHSSCNGTQVKKGEPVFIELGACVGRYTAPLMRTAVATEAPLPLRRLADHSLRAVEGLLAAMRAGVRACDVAQKGREAIAPIESEVVFHYVFGYSVGVGFPPSWLEESDFFLRLDNLSELQAGMVFHLPMTLRVFGRYGVGFSETVLVTEKGCEVLTDVERELVVR